MSSLSKVSLNFMPTWKKKKSFIALTLYSLNSTFHRLSFSVIAPKELSYLQERFLNLATPAFLSTPKCSRMIGTGKWFSGDLTLYLGSTMTSAMEKQDAWWAQISSLEVLTLNLSMWSSTSISLALQTLIFTELDVLAGLVILVLPLTSLLRTTRLTCSRLKMNWTPRSSRYLRTSIRICTRFELV